MTKANTDAAIAYVTSITERKCKVVGTSLPGSISLQLELPKRFVEVDRNRPKDTITRILKIKPIRDFSAHVWFLDFKRRVVLRDYGYGRHVVTLIDRNHV